MEVSVLYMSEIKHNKLTIYIFSCRNSIISQDFLLTIETIEICWAVSLDRTYKATGQNYIEVYLEKVLTSVTKILPVRKRIISQNGNSYIGLGHTEEGTVY